MWGPGSGASLEGPESRHRSLALDARRRSGFTAVLRGEAAPPSAAGPTGISEMGCGVHRPVAGRPGSSAVSLLTPWSSHQQLQEDPEGTVSARPGAQGHACAGPRPEARGHRERSGRRGSVSRYSSGFQPKGTKPSPRPTPIPSPMGLAAAGGMAPGVSKAKTGDLSKTRRRSECCLCRRDPPEHVMDVRVLQASPCTST